MTDRKPFALNGGEALQSYYAAWESRIGYKILLGDTRHFGYYDRDTYSPYPVWKALRKMEDYLYEKLHLKDGSTVLDAGCGAGKVAIRLASKGLRIRGIDLVDHHLQKAVRNIAAAGLEDRVSVEKGNYHDLKFNDASLDGVYTIETFVHATDPELVVSEFMRVLRPGGRLAMHEYEFKAATKDRRKLVHLRLAMNKYAAMPAVETFEEGSLQRMLEEAGFVDVKVEDIGMHIRPMLRYFYVLALVPYVIFTLLGIRTWFTNTSAAYYLWKRQSEWRYVSVSARKPDVNEQPKA